MNIDTERDDYDPRDVRTCDECGQVLHGGSCDCEQTRPLDSLCDLPTVRHEPRIEIDLSDDDGLWCIERKDAPDLSICGEYELTGPIIPDREIPNELRCKKCWAIVSKAKGGAK